ncbi:hypothetical protein [Pseudoalteromonas sp. 2CM32C]|uniref:hypothetical protein n=1 Tax=Pseudoalteromonas sp. 2CM32C TaxID=2929852 RepID=UPI0020C15151|nr:hypothetical protein [Pseudoalteromonas sp. 2CM32C]MCK8120535.1 hypothetical protein [Pseudoalteromonas sp. 2CM32C]
MVIRLLLTIVSTAATCSSQLDSQAKDLPTTTEHDLHIPLLQDLHIPTASIF